VTYQLKGTSGPVVNQAFVLETRHLLGTSEDCDIRVEGLEAERAVAEINVHDGLIRLVALNGGGAVFLNGESVASSELGSGDEIRIGHCRFIVQAPGLRPERVLVGEAIRTRRPAWPWLLLGLAAAGAALAWRQGWLNWTGF
jgi:hypothetical protein